MRPEICVGAIAIDEDDLLLIKRGRGVAAGFWSVPGGRVEEGETLAEAVVRELHEETGIEGVCGELVGVEEVLSEGLHFVILDYAVSVLERAEPVAGDDAAEAAWVPLSDIAELPLTEGLAEFLHDHGILRTIV